MRVRHRRFLPSIHQTGTTDGSAGLFEQACELRWQGVYDFGTSNLASRIRDAGMALSMEQDYWHTPPADALFLHRKLGGLYWRQNCKRGVDVGELFAPYELELCM